MLCLTDFIEGMYAENCETIIHVQISIYYIYVLQKLTIFKLVQSCDS